MRPVTAPAVPSTATALSPLSITDYSITGGFWADMQNLNRDAIIPHCDASLERVGWVDNFRAAARGTLGADRVGKLFTDSEIYKTMEAMIWENARAKAPSFMTRVSEYAELLQAAQSADGYLNTYYGYEGGPSRYSDMEWGHELYCAGHLLQAAVAAIRADGPKELIDVAMRVADHLCAEFADGARESLCGHPEIETALVELYRVTGERRYLDQARLFVDRRGHQILNDTMYKGRDYYQDNVPVKDARILVGHAVRALYLAAGAIDVAVETGDTELLAAVKAQYDATLQRRTYLTGGMGSNHHGETFGEDFELPSERAYAETCAAVASVHVAWRLLLATGDSYYADVIERALYNNVVSSPSADGRSFFYVNALQRRAPGIQPESGVPSLRRTDGMRASWFTTSCCPTNLARLLASLGGYLATTSESGIQLHQYATGTVTAEINGGPVRLHVETEYPYEGTVVIRVEEADAGEWNLGLRIPPWAGQSRVEVGGTESEAGPGRFDIARTWAPGDEVRLHLDVRPRFVLPDTRIDHLRACAAVERGPLVYTLESVDHPDADLELVSVDMSKEPVDGATAEGLGDTRAVRVSGTRRSAPPASEAARWPYQYCAAESQAEPAEPAEWTLIPYFRWANRGSSTMRVWLPRTDIPAN